MKPKIVRAETEEVTITRSYLRHDLNKVGTPTSRDVVPEKSREKIIVKTVKKTRRDVFGFFLPKK